MSFLREFGTGYESVVHNLFTKSAFGTIFFTAGFHLPVFRSDSGVIQHFTPEKYSVSGFGEVKKVAGELAGSVRFQHQTRIAVSPGRQFEHRNDIFIMMDIFRADQRGVTKIFRFAGILCIKPAAENRILIHAAFALAQFVQMGDQIIVEGLHRTVAQTAAVGKQTDVLIVCLCPIGNLPEGFRMIIYIPLDAEAVKTLRSVIQRLQRPQFHID